jgi:hypothetical protein
MKLLLKEAIHCCSVHCRFTLARRLNALQRGVAENTMFTRGVRRLTWTGLFKSSGDSDGRMVTSYVVMVEKKMRW